MKAAVKKLLELQAFGGAIAFLIVFSVVCFSLETLPNIKPLTARFLYYAEIVVVSVFSLEYLLRLYAAENRVKFVFSFFGLVDILAIAPFYLGLAVDLRSLRLLRLMRLARLLKLFRYHRAIARFSKALYMVKEELVLFFLATLVFIYLAAVGIYYFEGAAQPQVYRSIFDALWWAVVSLTTVGYGDLFPVTVGGRIFTFGILMLGLGLVAVPTGIISSALSTIRAEERDNI